jgi:L-lactate dehydrogenase
MEAKTRNAVYEIIEKKGVTHYAIALVVAKIVRAILSDQTRIYTVSRYIDSACGVSDVCLSLPTIVRKNGACEFLKIELNSKEKELLQVSAQKIKTGIELANSILEI